jgi:hypothetical protein
MGRIFWVVRWWSTKRVQRASADRVVAVVVDGTADQAAEAGAEVVVETADATINFSACFSPL